jgi:hypothetical protein
MTRLIIALAMLVALAAPLPASAKPVTAQALIDGPWQFGLYGRARDMPIGFAFKSGITATVVTFRADGTLRLDIPCRSEEFLQSLGGEFHIDGTWTLQPSGALELVMDFRGETRKEKYSASLENDELIVLAGGGGTKRMGRFKADLNAACLNQ